MPPRGAHEGAGTRLGAHRYCIFADCTANPGLELLPHDVGEYSRICDETVTKFGGVLPHEYIC